MSEDKQTNEDEEVPTPEAEASGDVTAEESGNESAPEETEVVEEIPTDLSPEEIKTLHEQASKAKENWEKVLRLTADFDNFKKRAARDRLEAIKYANEALVERILPIMDNFEMALMAANQENTSVDSLKVGVNMIHTQLKNLLGESGLEEIDALGKDFDPAIHEAISQKVTEDAPEGQVLEQTRKGYRLKERLVRPASVVVAAKASDETAETEKDES